MLLLTKKREHSNAVYISSAYRDFTPLPHYVLLMDSKNPKKRKISKVTYAAYFRFSQIKVKNWKIIINIRLVRDVFGKNKITQVRKADALFRLRTIPYSPKREKPYAKNGAITECKERLLK